MIIGGTPVPKREIVDLILRVMSADQVCDKLKIQPDTILARRLSDFTKSELVEVIESTAEGKTALEETKTKYPLTTQPTLYLISVISWPDQQVLLARSADLSERMSRAAVFFGDDRLVRSIYMITAAREYQDHIPFIEIPLVYEKKIEYVISDPDSEDYGEVDVVYSLEKAFVWYSHQFKHALLLCGDFPAVKPILHYGINQLGIRWQLPYLSEEMLHRLAEGANPRTASFSRLEADPDDDLDVQTMMISDQWLGASQSYRRLTQDGSRHQTSGFYSNHPDLVYGGLGISRQYGRIWTPAKLRKDSLLALSINLIQKTEEELNREAEINLGGFIGYYRNTPLTLARKKVNKSQRTYIEELTRAIITARRSPSNEIELDDNLVRNLLIHSENLDLVPALEIQCEDCGNYLLRCPVCQAPYEPEGENQDIVFRCPKHPEEITRDNQSIACECGGENEITYSTDLRIFPGAEILKTLQGFLAVMENQQYDGSFVIIGNLLHLVPKARTGAPLYTLNNFRSWRVRAHIHQRNLPDNKAKKYKENLSRIKEKCSRNEYHPTRAICTDCMDEEISKSRIQAGNEFCLPRLFGYAIDMNFDGVHHGHEIADIRYDDVLYDTEENLALGIHLKSRQYPRARGLGRSVECVKGLYTQYCYSAYLAAMRGERIDVIGISVPNVINDQVIENFEYLATQLGFPLMVLSEDDWVKILDVAIEKSEIGN